MLIVLGVTLAVVSSALSESTHTCNGTIGFSIVYGDGQIRNVTVDGVSGSPTDKETITPNPDALQRFRFTKGESFAGENGIEINNERRHILLIPGGRYDSYVVHLLNYATEAPAWSTIDVYCQPLGLAYRPESDEIVGFCRVNTTYYDGTITCVPYFVLRMENDRWVDVSQSDSCSQRLSTANITNPVILQGDTDSEVDAVRLYFGERGTNRLHEVSLSASGGSNFYNIDDAMLKIDHLVQASNSSLRAICYAENSFGYYQKSFLWQTQMQTQQTGFTSGFVLTESTAFDSYNLNYLVTFSANRNTVFIKEDGQSQPFQLSHVLDDPSQCQNLVGPATHYLICLAENGYLPLLINITSNSVTNQTILVNESKSIIKIGKLTGNRFYLLNDQQELSIYLITAMVVCVGVYPVRSNTDFIITSTFGDINCTIMEESDSNTDESRSVSVVAIVVPIIVAVAVIIGIIVVIFIVVWWRKIKKRPTINRKKEDDKVHNESYVKMEEPVKESNDNNTDLNNPNSNGSIPEDIAQPTMENGYTGVRNAEQAEDPPTNSVDPSEEVGSNQHCVLVHSTLKGFANAALDPTRRVQNESNSNETQFVEQNTENCIVPLQCSKSEEKLPAREDPVGDESK